MVFKERQKENKFKRVIKKVARTTEQRWKKGMSKIDRKVAWCRRKFVKMTDSETEREKWLDRVARGSGKERVRVVPEVPIFGDVQPPLDEDELNALKLPPKHTLYPKVTEEEIRLQSDITNTKARWDRASNRDFDAHGKEVTPEEDLLPKTMQQLLDENTVREVLNTEEMTLGFGNLRPTEVKNNPRTVLPDPITPAEEAELSTRSTMILQEAREYMWDAKEISSLTESEKRGLQKLTKRVDAGTIVICQTDKSGKLTAMTPEVYRKIGDVHCQGDQTVTWEDVQSAQRLLKGHLRIVNHIFRPGANTAQEDRVWKAKELHSTVIPVNSMLVKDHKPLTEEGLPKTRPVCGASYSLNGEMSEWISDIMDAICQAEETDEAISGEEMRSEIDKVAEELLKSGEVPPNGVFVGSLDAEALYPSLDTNKCAQICEDRVLASKINFEGVDYSWATRYVALNMTQDEINRARLHRIIPRKKAKSGSRPTVRTWEDEEKKERWVYRKGKAPNQMTELDKKRVISKVIGIMIRTTMDNHFYKWGEDVKKQVRGGGIGIRGTGSISRVTMDLWIQMFRNTL